MRLSAPLVAGGLTWELDGMDPPLVRQGTDVAVYGGDTEGGHEPPARRQHFVGAQRSSLTCEDIAYGAPLPGIALH